MAGFYPAIFFVLKNRMNSGAEAVFLICPDMRFWLPLIALLSVACNGNREQKEIREGKMLAEKHCSGCHQFPQPELLDKKTWLNHVLPKMGGLLAFRHFEGATYLENDNMPPVMKPQEWKQIIRYYLTSSPDSLRSENAYISIDTSFTIFKYQASPFRISPPLTSAIKILPPVGNVMFADGLSGKLYRLNNMQVTDSLMMETGISQIIPRGQDLLILSMGVMHPSDVKNGRLTLLRDGSKQIILDSLQRPVHASLGDLNDDGQTDIVMCEFGNNAGQLSWFEKRADSGFIKHTLRPLPGAVKTILHDFNNDNRPDILALMAQGDEGLFIYFNEGNGRFREENIIRFSPAHGSDYFEMTDVNGDNHPDIIVTNGDNGDYPPILKPYHGIRIYLNNGRNKFEEKVFLQMNGAYKVITHDFDADGDKDLASIAYFPDYNNRPEEAFVYWQNNGNLDFRPFSIPAAASGRWLVMDAADVDDDGDEDIVLGSAKMAMGSIPQALLKRWSDASPSVVLLENKTKNEK